MSDPKRWLDAEDGLEPHERRLLESAKDLRPSADQEDRMWAMLSTMGPVGAAGSGQGEPRSPEPSTSAGSGGNSIHPGSALKASAAGMGTKATLAVFVVAVAAIGTYLAARSNGEEGQRATAGAAANAATMVLQATAASNSASEPMAGGSVAAPIPNILDLPVEKSATSRGSGESRVGFAPAASAATPSESSSSELGAASQSTPSTQSPTTASSAPLPNSESGNLSTLREEALMLEAARAALQGGDTHRAQQVLHDMRVRFPRGQLGEEREVLAIEILARSGRAAEAVSRASAFLESHPRSPYAPRMRELAGSP